MATLEQREPKNLVQGLIAIGTLATEWIQQARQSLISAAESAERQYYRAELLAAYRCRHSWKKSDLPNLRSLNVNAAARKRMERLVGTGRPLVKEHQPAGSSVIKKTLAFQILINPASTASERRKAIKRSPWWPHYVEALYRGEHALAKKHASGRTAGRESPSTQAEQVVGAALGISAATVHSLCGGIRRTRETWAGAADFPSITLDDYDQWMKTGTAPWAESADF